ncbi:hypothetical protein [Streptomyces griseofuscus]|uniref:hypothetical protein n=1 Tax=Streptomyces griseofuscus TaxID=146922 RepID=UPI001FD25ED8|nr:hypothetical protein [Streptomyces griseofuscus]
MDRYHLLLATSLRPVQQGWWGSEAVARDKFRRWIGEYGGMPGRPSQPHRRGDR